MTPGKRSMLLWEGHAEKTRSELGFKMRERRGVSEIDRQ